MTSLKRRKVIVLHKQIRQEFDDLFKMKNKIWFISYLYSQNN